MPDDENVAQSALSAWGTDEGEDTDSKDEPNSGDSTATETDSGSDRTRRGRSVFADPAISDEAVLTDESCPWCLHPSDDFVERTNDDEDVIGELVSSPQISCGNCHAVIPVESDWYQKGEKICV